MKYLSLIISFVLITFTTSLYAQEYIIRNGDTLQQIFGEYLSTDKVQELKNDIKIIYPQFKLKNGNKIILNNEHAVLSSKPDFNIIIHFKDNDYRLETEKLEIDTLTSIITGSIETNLFDAVKSIGEDDELSAMIASIYEWEIDFFRDIQYGDRFTVLVEKKFINNEYIGYGKILAAEFINNGKRKSAIYFEEGKVKGYYNEKGKSFDRGFLRVPLNYSRISSRFTTSRYHPLFMEHMPHYGVDYAAPIGTPVYATAGGIIEKMEYGDNGNGNFIIINHQNGYKTYYLHLNGYNQSLSVGDKVARGQTIAYVGNTGASTAPHLDYRVNYNGTWLNPLKMTIKTAPSLPNAMMTRFKAIAEVKMALLNSVEHLYAYDSKFIKMLPF